MSKTTDNLKAAFAGESQARNKYTFFANVARKEGYHYIAKLFDETAFNEMQHAKDHLKLLGGIGDTLANLKEAMGGEDYEVESMYPQFAKEAEAEGETQAMIAFQQVARIEAHHRERYRKLIEMVKAGTVYKREQPIKWKCGICGYIVEGTEPPSKCPSCKHAKEFYEPANMDF
ncbi:rubrerythrin family protein [Desulfosarcina sp.]|uniref:rubrerythrin family protein n=1 Tax=Desulfosarcina sp. TaxID=2027861 RepID=UPI003970E652